MTLDNHSSKQFQSYSHTAISEVLLDDITLDAISAGGQDAVKVLLTPVAKALDDFFKLFKS
jgi:hypothetical protein